MHLTTWEACLLQGPTGKRIQEHLFPVSMSRGASEKVVVTICAVGITLTQNSTASQATRGAGDHSCASKQHLCNNKGCEKPGSASESGRPASDQSWVSLQEERALNVSPSKALPTNLLPPARLCLTSCYQEVPSKMPPSSSDFCTCSHCTNNSCRSNSYFTEGRNQSALALVSGFDKAQNGDNITLLQQGKSLAYEQEAQTVL